MKTNSLQSEEQSFLNETYTLSAEPESRLPWLGFVFPLTYLAASALALGLLS